MKIRKKHIYAVVALVALLASLIGGALPAAASNGAWWNASWEYRTEITIDNSNVDENLTDFPLLVCLDSGDVDYSHTEDDGSDIRFIDADGTTLLPHEIEDWNEAGTSYVWVRVDIDADPATELIYMYYGNPSPPAPPDPTTVWSNGYVGVWHLHDDEDDSTSNGNNGTNSGSTNATGRIADAQEFEETESDFITVPDDEAGNDTLDITEGTLEAWVYIDTLGPDTGDNWDRIIGRENNNLTEDYCLLIHEDTYEADLWACDPGPGERLRVQGSTALTEDNWTYVAAVQDNADSGTASIYLFDGVVNGLDNSATPSQPFCETDYDVLIGASDRDFFDGIIDEVRISSVPRSAEWLEATYDCTNNCAAFTTFAAEEDYWDCTFTDTVRDTELRINTEQGTFRFLTPISTGATYDSGVVTASHMRVRMDGYGQARINIWHKDGSTRLWVSAICGPADLCSASLKDLSSGTLYRLRDNRGIEP